MAEYVCWEWWLRDIGMVYGDAMMDYRTNTYWVKMAEKAREPIPPEIAKALGLEPIEDI